MAVDIVCLGKAKKYPTDALRKIAEELLVALRRDRSELSIALVGDREMRPLNKKYRQYNRTTDVLSFAVHDQPKGGAAMLGDVVISVEQARRQAKARQAPVESEMAALLIHGLLHLLGYDHEGSMRQAQVMYRLERKLHARLCERGFLQV